MTTGPTATFTLAIQEWATFERRFLWKDSVGAAIGLTAYTAKLQVRDDDGALLLELTETDGITLADGTDGWNIKLLISSEETGGLTWSEAKYDLVLEDVAHERRRLLEGRCYVEPAITEFDLNT